MRKPFSIRLFQPDYTSGGIKVMYALYGALLTKGEEVYANAIIDQVDCVGIYPEISQGNELQSKTVVRYLLNKPGVMCSNGVPGPTTFAPTDILFSFSKMFTPDFPDDRLMFLPVINTKVFYDKKGKRDKNAVFLGKGIPNTLHPENCIVIDRQVAQDQEKLAEILNECQCLYSYDPVSAMTEIARLCGCRVVYLSNEYSEKDYELYEPGINGMSFNLHEKVELDSDAFAKHYKSLQTEFWKKLDNFINLTQL